MKIIDEIIEELTTKSCRMTDVLIKTKVLAFKLKNKELSTWIDNELNGYTKDILPDYRILKCEIKGTISNGFQRINNYPIPLLSFKKEDSEAIKTIRLSQSISTLDEFIHAEKGNNLVMNIAPEIYGFMSKDFDNGFFIEFARKEVGKAQIIQTLTAVKSKLLDFLLTLNDELGDVGDIKPLSDGISTEKVTSLFNSAVFGNNATIIVGDNNTQTIKNITKGNFDSLSKILKENGILDNDIKELETVIDVDLPNIEKRTYGEKVNNWITKMLTKVMDNSWKISLGAAGKLLADAIEMYYGWK